MSPKQRVLFSQLQIAGLGIVIAVMAWILEMPVFYYVGGGVFLFGVIRLLFLGSLIKGNGDWLDLEDVTPHQAEKTSRSPDQSSAMQDPENESAQEMISEPNRSGTDQKESDTCNKSADSLSNGFDEEDEEETGEFLDLFW